MRGMLQEFKEFALRGNMVDMAVGIIIGAAFSTIVRSLVDDIVMPPLGVLTGGVDFSNMFISLDGESYASLAQAKEAGAPTINFGVFVNNVISFAIVAFALLAAAAIGALFLQPPRSGDAPQPSAGSEAVETQDGLPPSRE